MIRAVALLSGGLDSTLAVKMMVDQGIEVFALNFTSAFCTCTSSSRGGCKSESRRVAEEFNIPIKVLTKGLDYMEIVRDPKHGYGKGVNPCVDCRIYMFSRAKEYMDEIGASFIITGEVLGQRPMSQRRDSMSLIEREVGLEGLILRPLSAKQLEPTIPEKSGLVDRNKLLDVVGRSRRTQIDLAEHLDVADYPCPSGGCLLTDKIFSKKVRDLLENKKSLTTRDLVLLKTGRHFRFEDVKVVVGRDEAENTRLKAMLGPDDTLIEPVDFPGPVAVVVDSAGFVVRDFAGGLVVRYASGKAGANARLRSLSGETSEVFEIERPLADDMIEGARVC